MFDPNLPYHHMFLMTFSLFAIRYVLFSGAAYFFVWKAGKERFQDYRIQKKDPPRRIVIGEFLYSMCSNVMFALTAVVALWTMRQGWTQIYWNISDFGWAYFGFSIYALILLHDTYFYFTHRAMHHPKLYKLFHAVHHRSINPTPWAAFSFDPAEAVVQALFVNLVILVMPIHPGALIAWGFFMMGMNVIGHLGHEFFPKWTPVKVMNTSTHHSMHHKYFNCNYALYFNWWDRLLGTNHELYEERFYSIKDRRSVAREPAALDIEGVSHIANG